MIFYKYLPPERINILENCLIRFTQPKVLNDPFEGRPNFHATTEGFASVFADTIRQKPRMWEDCRRKTQTDLDRHTFADTVEGNPDYAAQLYRSLGSQRSLFGLQGSLYDLPERLYELYNRVGILSLSETPDNRLMWAHYAEEHTGFVLMLDGYHDFFKGDNLSSKIAKGFAKPERVEYRLERPRTSIEDPPREILLIKDSDWKYEKEWRYLKHIDDAAKLCGDPTLPVALFRLPPKCIRGIILGYNSSKKLKDKIVALRCDDPEFGHLRIQQAGASTTRYPLRIEEIKT